MDHSTFETTDQKLTENLKVVREKKIPEGFLENFSSDIEEKIRAKQDQRVRGFTPNFHWGGFGVGALAVMILASSIVFRLPSSQPLMELAQADLRDISEEVAVLSDMDALSGNDISIDDIDDETLAALDEIA